MDIVNVFGLKKGPDVWYALIRMHQISTLVNTLGAFYGIRFKSVKG
jgi:hypothetical protein